MSFIWDNFSNVVKCWLFSLSCLSMMSDFGDIFHYDDYFNYVDFKNFGAVAMGYTFFWSWIFKCIPGQRDRFHWICHS